MLSTIVDTVEIEFDELKIELAPGVFTTAIFNGTATFDIHKDGGEYSYEVDSIFLESFGAQKQFWLRRSADSFTNKIFKAVRNDYGSVALEKYMVTA